MNTIHREQWFFFFVIEIVIGVEKHFLNYDCKRNFIRLLIDSFSIRSTLTSLSPAISIQHQWLCSNICLFFRWLVSKLFDVCPRSTLAEIEQKDEIRVAWGTGIAGYVAESGEPVNIPDAYQVSYQTIIHFNLSF